VEQYPVARYPVDGEALDAAMAASHAIVGTAVQAMTMELPDITWTSSSRPKLFEPVAKGT
jgi:hypothetical protein